MHIELHCSHCAHHFEAPQHTLADKILQRMHYEGAWHGIQEGATFEDMVYAGLVRTGYIGCPECGEVATIRGSRQRLTKTTALAGDTVNSSLP